jgi:segregation and condensation protein B
MTETEIAEPDASEDAAPEERALEEQALEEQTREAQAGGDHFQWLRLLEAMLFAASEPLPEAVLARRLPEGTAVGALLEELAGLYGNRGVNLVCRDGCWAFRTAPDLGHLLQIEREVPRKLSRAAVETLAIIAYHQPVTRAEIEEIRGVALSKGTLDSLLEASWIRPKGRRRTPGRPVTWVTTESFYDHFGLEGRDSLPGMEELRAAGLLETRSAIAVLGTQALAAAGGAPGGSEAEDEDDEDFDEEALARSVADAVLDDEAEPEDAGPAER